MYTNVKLGFDFVLYLFTDCEQLNTHFLHSSVSEGSSISMCGIYLLLSLTLNIEKSFSYIQLISTFFSSGTKEK